MGWKIADYFTYERLKKILAFGGRYNNHAALLLLPVAIAAGGLAYARDTDQTDWVKRFKLISHTSVAAGFGGLAACFAGAAGAATLLVKKREPALSWREAYKKVSESDALFESAPEKMDEDVNTGRAGGTTYTATAVMITALALAATLPAPEKPEAPAEHKPAVQKKNYPAYYPYNMPINHPMAGIRGQ